MPNHQNVNFYQTCAYFYFSVRLSIFLPANVKSKRTRSYIFTFFLPHFLQKPPAQVITETRCTSSLLYSFHSHHHLLDAFFSSNKPDVKLKLIIFLTSSGKRCLRASCAGSMLWFRKRSENHAHQAYVQPNPAKVQTK